MEPNLKKNIHGNTYFLYVKRTDLQRSISPKGGNYVSFPLRGKYFSANTGIFESKRISFLAYADDGLSFCREELSFEEHMKTVEEELGGKVSCR
jgi:hypothetical protein